MTRRKNWQIACVFATFAALATTSAKEPGAPVAGAVSAVRPDTAADSTADDAIHAAPRKLAAIAPFVNKGVAWLIAAQHPDGGWGGGSHANQQNRDPLQVQTDPGTTAFTLLSLLRAGNTPVAGW